MNKQQRKAYDTDIRSRHEKMGWLVRLECCGIRRMQVKASGHVPCRVRRFVQTSSIPCTRWLLDHVVPLWCEPRRWEHLCHRWPDHRSTTTNGNDTEEPTPWSRYPWLQQSSQDFPSSRRGTRGHESATRYHRCGGHGATRRAESESSLGLRCWKSVAVPYVEVREVIQEIGFLKYRTWSRRR